MKLGLEFEADVLWRLSIPFRKASKEEDKKGADLFLLIGETEIPVDVKLEVNDSIFFIETEVEKHLHKTWRIRYIVRCYCPEEIKYDDEIYEEAVAETVKTIKELYLQIKEVKKCYY